MSTKKQKNEMIDYLGDKITLSGYEVKQNSVTFEWDNKPTNYLKIGENKFIFMLDDNTHYNEKTTKTLIKKLRENNIQNPLFVFYKDGNSFFRNHASSKNSIKSKYSKLNQDRSLKNYNSEDLRNSLLLTEAERKIKEIRTGLQYYQPKSERLEEMLVHFEINPFIYDYSHMSPEERVGPVKRVSKKLYQIKKRIEIPGNIEVGDYYLQNPKN